jgi:hypothetical protein
LLFSYLETFVICAYNSKNRVDFNEQKVCFTQGVSVLQDSSSHLIIKRLAPSKDRLPLFIVGDVHGCAHELAELLVVAKKHVPQFQLMLVGDLFTKGPDPVGVFEIIQEHSALCLKGNHDWALCSTLQQTYKRGLHSFSEHTKQTLHFIRYHKRAFLYFLSSLPHAYVTTVLSKSKRNWEDEYPLIVVHAGIDASQGLYHSTERMLLTARYVRWEIKDKEKKLVVVPAGYRAEVLNQEEFSQGGDHQFKTHENHFEKERFRWHELHKGPALIVFGHDAKQGLFRKTLASGRPICVGLDTGCTYGNSLTGYFPESDLALQVRAQRKYFDIKNNIILSKPQHSKMATF